MYICMYTLCMCVYIYKQHPSGDHRLMVRVKGDSNAIQKRKAAAALWEIHRFKCCGEHDQPSVAERGPQNSGPKS